MKTKQIAVVFLLFFSIILGGCPPKNIVSNEKTYNIIVPSTAKALKEVSLVIQEEQLIFIRNNKELYAARVLPRPPAPCELKRCLPDDFKFTLIDKNKAIIQGNQPEMVWDVDIANLPIDLKNDIMALESQTFSAKLGTPLQIKR